MGGIKFNIWIPIGSTGLQACEEMKIASCTGKRKGHPTAPKAENFNFYRSHPFETYHSDPIKPDIKKGLLNKYMAPFSSIDKQLWILLIC